MNKNTFLLQNIGFGVKLDPRTTEGLRSSAQNSSRVVVVYSQEDDKNVRNRSETLFSM